MAMDDQEMMAEEPGEDEGGESSNRTFMMLAFGLGGLFIVGVICIVAIFFYQQSQRSTQVARNNAQIAKNATAVAAATIQAMPTEVPTQAPPTVAPTVAPTTAPTAAPTNTPVPAAAAGGAPTETPMVTATAAKPAATVTATKSASGSTTGGAAAVTPTAAMTAEKTPDTGVGGFGMVLAAAVLLVVLFAARRLRLSPR